MPTRSITASLRRIESSEVRSSIDLSVCEHRESSAASPRRLCISRRRRPARPECTLLLDVHVASCTHACEGAPTSALIFMSGELSATTIDEVVWNSVMEFAAFAHSVVVDLTHVDRIDERGAEMVEALYRVVDGVGGRLSLHNPNCVVENVLRFCGISDRIVICQPTTPDRVTSPARVGVAHPHIDGVPGGDDSRTVDGAGVVDNFGRSRGAEWQQQFERSTG